MNRETLVKLLYDLAEQFERDAKAEKRKDEGRLNCKQKNSKQGENLTTDSQAKFTSAPNAENLQKTKASAPNAEDNQTDSLTGTNIRSRKNQKKL